MRMTAFLKKVFGRPTAALSACNAQAGTAKGGPGLKGLTREEAVKVVQHLCDKHDIPHVLFESREAADQLVKDMIAASALRARMQALGIDLPEGMSH